MERWDIVNHHGTKVVLLEKIEESSLWKVCTANYMKAEIQLVKEAELSPITAEYQLPVTWECYGTITVSADSMKEAIRIFDQKADEYPLPEDSGYVDGSFMREPYGSLEEESKVYALRQLPIDLMKQLNL